MRKKPPTIEQALEKMRGLCAVSEQCSFDIRRKLMLMGMPRDSADKLVESLVGERFVDDERFARAFVRHAYRFSRWGRRKIAAALYAKRIPSSLVSLAIDEEIDTEEYESTARSVLTAKTSALDRPFTYEVRAKLLRFGVSRGYEPALISKILEDIL